MPSKDWCTKMAELEGEEGDQEIGAGLLARDPVPVDDEYMPYGRLMEWGLCILFIGTLAWLLSGPR